AGPHPRRRPGDPGGGRAPLARGPLLRGPARQRRQPDRRGGPVTTTTDPTAASVDPPAPPPRGQGYPQRPVQRETGRIEWGQITTVARTDLKQLLQAKDFWGPMVGLGAIFFCV